MTVEKDIWIFLSHSSADFEKVRLIRNYLEEKKCRPLMFYLKCLNSEEETFELIKREIDVRTRFVVCDSDNARASKWVRKEIEYITGKEPKRSYLRLDLTKSINELKTDIDLYVSKTAVYISYRRRDLDMVRQVKNRLAKYDVRVFVGADKLESVDFRLSLTQAIVHASNCGYFIFICSDGLLSEGQKQELGVAIKANADVLVIATTKCVDPFLSDLQSPKGIIVRIDDYSENMSDKVTDEILWHVLPSGAVHTFAHNFRTGTNGKKDGDEADKLDSLLVRKAKVSDNPAALAFLARCYENGEHGLPVNLRKALEYYDDVIHGEGRTADLVQHTKEVNEKLQQLQRTEHERLHPSLLRRIRNLLKNWRVR